MYSLDKYEIIEFANGLAWDAKETKFLPWKCYGSLPSDPARIHQLNKDPNLARAAGYGAEMIDEIIKQGNIFHGENENFHLDTNKSISEWELLKNRYNNLIYFRFRHSVRLNL